MQTFEKDPEAILDWSVGWSEWLESGDAIASFDVSASGPDESLVVSNETHTDGVVSFWLAGGMSESYYRVVCEITTTGGRTDKRSFYVKVLPR